MKHTNLRDIILIILGIVVLGGIAYAGSLIHHTTDINGNTALTGGGGGWQIPPQNTTNVIGPDGSCKTVTNISSSDLYVPVNSTTEWSDFVNTSGGGQATVSTCTCSINLPIYEYATGAPSGQQCGFGVGVPSPHVFNSGTTYTLPATGASVSGSYSISCVNGQLANQTWSCTYGAVK